MPDDRRVYFKGREELAALGSGEYSPPRRGVRVVSSDSTGDEDGWVEISSRATTEAATEAARVFASAPAGMSSLTVLTFIRPLQESVPGEDHRVR